MIIVPDFLDSKYGCHAVEGIFYRLCFRSGRFLRQLWAMYPENLLPQRGRRYESSGIARAFLPEREKWLNVNIIKPVFAYHMARRHQLLDKDIVPVPPLSCSEEGIRFATSSRVRWQMHACAEYIHFGMLDTANFAIIMRAASGEQILKIDLHYSYVLPSRRLGIIDFDNLNIRFHGLISAPDFVSAPHYKEAQRLIERFHLKAIGDVIVLPYKEWQARQFDLIFKQKAKESWSCLLALQQIK